MSKTVYSPSDTARPIKVVPVLRAFPSTVMMLSTLFVAALISIMSISYIYNRLTKLEGFENDAWESWAFFLQTTLGLGMTVAGVVATVWIAFRVEAIARRQVTNDDRDHDMALLRFDVIEPAKAATGPFFEALTRSRKASYLIQQIELDLENWHYHKINEVYPMMLDDMTEVKTSLDLSCMNCNLPVREQKVDQAIYNELNARKQALTRPYKQVLRRSFIDMYSVLDNLKRGSNVNPLAHIPESQCELMADYVQAYLDYMWSCDDLGQSTANFVNSLKRHVETIGEKGTSRPTQEEAPALFFEICCHHEGRDLDRNMPQGGEADPLHSYDDVFWRTKFLNSQALPDSFEIGFFIDGNAEVMGNMAQVLEASLLAGMHSQEAFEGRIARYVASKDGILTPDRKTWLLCWSEYRSALTRDVDGLTTTIILDAMHRNVSDIPELRLRLVEQDPNDIYPDAIAQEDEQAVFISKISKKPLKTCACASPAIALGD